MSLRPLSKELQKRAEKEIDEVPKRIPEDLKYIKEWLAKQPHINARTDDQWLLGFLRGCKFSLERTKEKLDLFYTMRTIIPEFFANRDPLQPEIQEILSTGTLLPLPKTEGSDGPRILLTRNGLTDPEKVKVSDGIKVNLMILDILLLEDDNSMVTGQQLVQDVKGMTLAHALQMTPSNMKKAMTCFQHTYPNRTKGIHFINIPSFFETVYNGVRPLLTEKMKSRVNIVTSEKDYQKLYNAVPLSILPKEYGGEGGSVDEIRDEWKKKVESYRDWFLEDAKYGTVESKRPGKPKTASEVFGIEGSFRKLDVD